MRGLGAAGPWFRRGVPLSRDRAWPARVGRVAHSRVAGSPRVAGPPPAQPTGCVWWVVGLFDAGDGPAEAGQFAGGGDGDDGAAFGASFEPGPGAVQALLGALGDRDRFGGLAGLAVGEGFAGAGSGAVVPGGLDEQAAGVAGAGLGDRALAAVRGRWCARRARGRGSSSAARGARSVRSRRSLSTVRPRSGCRCRAGSAAGRPSVAHGEPGSSAVISRSSASRRCASASIAPWASSMRRLRGRPLRA